MKRADRTHSVHWVYRCFDADGRLVYVGSTTHLFNRLRSHRSSSWWAPQVAKVKATVHPDGIVAREIERTAIHDEVPRWNKAGKWNGRHLWTEADWRDWLTVLTHSECIATDELRRVIAHYTSLFGTPPPRMYAEAADAEDERRRQHRREMRDELAALRARRQA